MLLIPVTTVVGDDETVRLVKLMCEMREGNIWRIDSVENGEPKRPPFSLHPCMEGITWVIGHHDKTSDEGKALLVTWALKQERDE